MSTSAAPLTHPRAIFMDEDIIRALQALRDIADRTDLDQATVARDVRLFAERVLSAPTYHDPQVGQLQEKLQEIETNSQTLVEERNRLCDDCHRLQRVVDNLLAAPPARAAPDPHPQRPEDIPDPEKFDGSRKDFRPFVAQLRVKLAANNARFPTPQHRLG
jgi:hypothetical protein